ncbi:sensor histidine kinase [Bradyrhizobium sp. OAE829]|uniref:sensor histidine kinase n=1 Tax=Bradyrhizobium sp. OAE829 TaxID=2663807 RepID=UPI00178965BA
MHFWLVTLPWRSLYARTVTAALVVALLLATLYQSQAAAPEPKRVLILHSVGREFRPWNAYAKDIRAELDRQSRWPIDVQEHSLVAARSGDPRAEELFLEYIKELYAGTPPDLIISVGAPSAGFFQRHRRDLFPTTPILFTVLEQRRVQYQSLTENDTVVAVRHDFRVLFDSFLNISPDTKVVAVINGNSPNEKYWQKEMRRELQPLDGRIEIRWYDDLSYDEVLKKTASLPPHSAIFWYQMIVDAAGVAHEGDRALTRLYASANAPIFTHDDAFFGQEIVGGPMHSALGGSRRAMEVAMRILGGEKPGDIKTPPSDFAPAKYDWRELQRWKISESRLPPGSEILFREPTVWRRYSWQISLITAVMLLQAGFITALLHQRRRRQLAEVQARQRMAELAHVNRFSTAGVLTASLAHEINQPLGSILTNAETAQAILKSPSPDIVELNEIVDDIVRDDRRASEVIRRMKSLLTKTPFELKSLDLNDVARETVGFLSTLAVARKTELTSLITPNSLPILGDAIQLQQVILNLVVNGIDAMKDMPAENRAISIRTSRVGEFAELSVSDRGPGIPGNKLKEIFEPFFTSKPAGMGMGLSIAHTIVEAHHGKISAKNRDHGGASFTIRLPLTHNV